jgi:hypothetical protein
MIGFIGTSSQLQSNCNSSQWVSTTRSIPYWTTNVFSSTVTNLVLIYEWLRTNEPVTVAERSKACTVFARSEAGVVGSYLTQVMDV